MLLVAGALGSGVMGDAMLYAVLPANIDSFGLQVGLVGIILSANRFVRLASNAWAAWVYDRLGTYLPLLIALVVGGSITVGYGVVHGFWPLLGLRLLWGICFSFLRLGGYLTVLEEGVGGTRGWLMGVLNTGFRGGQLVGTLVGALLADVLGHPIAFPVLAALTGLSVVAILLGRGPVEEGRPLPKVERPRRLPLGFVERGFGRSVWNLLVSHVPDTARTVRMRLLAVNFSSFAVAFGAGGLLMATLGYILKGMVGDEARLGPLVMGATSITGVLLAMRWSSDLGLSALVGRLSDEWGRRAILRLSLPVLSAGLLLVGVLHHPVGFLLVLPFVFVASTATIVVLDAMAADLAPRERAAQVMSRYATWRDLGSALGPLVGYGMAVVVGLPWVYGVATGLLVFGSIVHLYGMRARVASGG